MAYKQLRNELLKILGISPSRLSQRCNQVKSNVPMSTKDATCIIAHQSGLKLDKYLDDDTINRIRTLLTQIKIPQQTSSIIKPLATKKQKFRQAIVNIGKEFSLTDPILTHVKLQEANEMSRVFPYLYLLENSIREFIDRLMTTQYGNDWWNSQAPKQLRDDVIKRMSDDNKDSWHQRRGARPIDYLDMKDLPRLMNKIESIVVPSIIPSLDWFRQLVAEVYKSRCVLCHMNPLDKNNIDAVKVRFNHWQKQIKEKKALIDSLTTHK